ncbi:MAG: D-aminoacyl-tRNA deacylase [Candidatus Woesearchaeota archaeon]
MNIVIFTFTKDSASMTQRSCLLDSFEKTKFVFDNYEILQNTSGTNTLFLAQTDKESVFYESIDEAFVSQTNIVPDVLIFLTKHQSASGINSLSCHTQGNWAKADFGGKDGVVAPCPVRLFNDVFQSIQKHNTLDFESIIEVTHHGPFVTTPSLWIEIGSNEDAWVRKDAGNVLKNVVLEVLPHCTLDISDTKEVLLGIGGMHHSPEFAKRILRNEAWVSHVCPKYMLETVSYEALVSAYEHSYPKPTAICYDWKSMTAKDSVVPMVEKLAQEKGLKILKTKNFK